MLLVAIHQLVKKSQKYSKSYSKCGRFALTTIMNNNIQTILGLTLLLWNSRSIYANIQEFKQLTNKHSPDIICLTETWLKETDKLHIKSYITYRFNRDNGRGGGLAILVHQKIKSTIINTPDFANGKLEKLKIKINISKNQWSELLLLYNPCENISQNEFNHYLENMDTNSIVCGDFNSHHNFWSGSTQNKTNISDRNLFASLQESNFILLTPQGTKTHYNPSTGTETTLDLVLGKRN